ncbi:MAG: SigE family RNA polymerase sigma factor [Actinomycetota bacterium]
MSRLSGSRDRQFEAFFGAESEGLRRFAAFLTGDADRATDLAQEALVRTYRQWRRIDSDPAAYARRIVVNLVRAEHRKSLVRRRYTPQGDWRTAPDTDRVDDWLRMTSALRTLSPIRRAAIVLRYYDDMSEADIAHVLNRPLGTVKSDIHRGLARLRQELDGAGGDGR